MEQEEQQEQVTEVEYAKAKLTSRWLAAIIDFALFFVLAAILYGCTYWVTSSIPAYNSQVELRNQLQEESGIYSDGTTLISTTVTEDDTLSTYEQKNYLSNIIDAFYLNDTFFEYDTYVEELDETYTSYYIAYQARKAEAVDEYGNNIFVSDNGILYYEGGYLSDVFLEFYVSEIETYCVNYLVVNADYLSATQLVFNTSVAELVITMAISFFLAYMVPPLIFKRGRQSLGMKITKTSLISAEALNVTTGKYWLRSLWLFLFGFVLDVIAFLIPLIVSVSMMHLSKRNQDFFDYISNTYVVDTSTQDVYLDYAEYWHRTEGRQAASIENNDFKIHRD